MLISAADQRQVSEQYGLMFEFLVFTGKSKGKSFHSPAER